MSDLIPILQHNVPRFIGHIKSKGGVSNEEWKWLTHGTKNDWEIAESEDPNYPSGLFLRADDLLLYPPNQETFNKSIFVLVLALAIMSFIPCGVRFGELRFDSDIEGFLEKDALH
jgi:hypothetical protein